MSPSTWLMLALAGGVGAVARFGVGSLGARLGPEFPYGTLAVNLLGSALLGVLVARNPGGAAWSVLATGALGAFTTFSAWMLEVHRMLIACRTARAATYLAISVAGGVVAFVLGRVLAA